MVSQGDGGSMKELIEGVGVEPGSPRRRRHRAGRLIRQPRPLVVLLCVALVGAALAACGSTTPSSASSSAPQPTRTIRTVSLVSKAYTPWAAVGTTDDYHCTLVDPHVTQDSYVISSQFHPGSDEVHHAVLA